MHPHLFCSDALPQVNKYLQDCKNIHQLHYVSIYYSNLHMIFTRSMHSMYKAKLSTCMDGIKSKTEMKQILTVCRRFDCEMTNCAATIELNLNSLSQILNFYATSTISSSSKHIRGLLLAIIKELPNLSNRDLRDVARVSIQFDRLALHAHFIAFPLPFHRHSYNIC